MNNKLTRAIALSATLAVLSGCVITVHDDKDSDSSSSWKVRQTENRNIITELSIGTDINQVTDLLGPADDSEGFEKQGKTYIVLFYRTHHRHEDGKTSRDETTPLIFKDGKLVGWGQSVLLKHQP